jgi:hypothetical protein
MDEPAQTMMPPFWTHLTKLVVGGQETALINLFQILNSRIEKLEETVALLGCETRTRTEHTQTIDVLTGFDTEYLPDQSGLCYVIEKKTITVPVNTPQDRTEGNEVTIEPAERPDLPEPRYDHSKCGGSHCWCQEVH